MITCAIWPRVPLHGVIQRDHVAPMAGSVDCDGDACDACDGASDAFPAEFELRRRCAALPGPNVLEVNETNILDYACGAWALVVHDLVAILGEAAG